MLTRTRTAALFVSCHYGANEPVGLNAGKRFAFTLLTVVLCFYLDPVWAYDFYTGKTFRVTGTWSGSVLHAERVQLRDSQPDSKAGRIVATIGAVDTNARTLKVGTLAVEWNDQTRFKDVTAADLAVGSPIRISVLVRGAAPLLATSFQQPSDPVPKDTAELTAEVSQVLPQSGAAITFRMLGVSVLMPQAGYNTVESLTRRQDARRPEQPLQFPVLGRPLSITGQYEATLRKRRNFELDDALEPEKRTTLDHELTIELFYPVNERTFLFAEGKAKYDVELRRTGRQPSFDRSLERGQTWVFFDRLAGSGFGLQLGRQNLSEAREWWWDTDLDAARLYYDQGPLHVEISASQEVARTSSLERHIDPEDKRVARLMARGSWQWARKQTVEVFALRHHDRSRTEANGVSLNEDDEDPRDASLTWLGLRAVGDRALENYGDLRYWADAGWVRGREKRLEFDTDNGVSTVDKRTDAKVRGSAFDLGLSWRTRLPSRPAFTLGYAQGSGDDSIEDGVDSAYQQTGLHSNKWRFFGVKRFRYYGELLRPELSNLRIVTAGAGLRFLNRSSVDLLYHRYRQTRAANALRDASVDADLTGKSRAVGEEYDLVLGLREWTHLDLALIASTFKAGNAFGSLGGKRANSLQFELTLNY